MINSKGFWLAQMVGLLALYGTALILALQGHTDSRVVALAAIILAVHVLEIPVAFIALKGRNAQPLRVIVATQLFGLLWWLPAKRGLFAVR